MYHLYTRQTDGVMVNQWNDDSLQAVKVYADQYYPHALCEIWRNEYGKGELMLFRTANGNWM